jgi:hypothetical protein
LLAREARQFVPPVRQFSLFKKGQAKLFCFLGGRLSRDCSFPLARRDDPFLAAIIQCPPER